MKYAIIPWIALSISLAVTTTIWITILDLDRQSQELEFIAFSEKLTSQFQEKLNTHEQVLRGFEGLFSASQEVTKNEFTNFFTIQQIPSRFPDSQGIGFIQHIDGETEKNELYQRLESYGLEYSIHPEGTRQEYYPVVFLEPQDFRNIRAIGYDVYSEEIRQTAIDNAIQTGKTTLTGKIVLVQETEEDIQNGFLMLLPVYEFDEKTGQFSELQGFVYSVFRMNDFVENVLGKEIFENFGIIMYDGLPNQENLFFDSKYLSSTRDGDSFSNIELFEFGGKQWTIVYHGFTPQSEILQTNREIIPIMGYSMSILLFYVFILFSKNVKLSKNVIKQEKTAAVGELASRFSHDVRNPLSNIKMALNLLEHDKALSSNEHAREKFQIISKNLERISHQVDDVLDFVRVRPPNKKHISAKSCISESIETIVIPQNISLDLPQNNVGLYGDSFQLQIVCKNLINNAIQAIGKEVGTIKIRLKEEPHWINIEFEDSGPGVPYENPSEIFEPLTTSKQTGTGLGLVSCKQIIENHGGSISVTLNPTKFLIKLPR